MSFYDNSLGYDIQSWSKDLSIMYIDSKKAQN